MKVTSTTPPTRRSARKSKQQEDVTPKKTDQKKKKVIIAESDSESEYDVADDVQNITPMSIKKSAVKHILPNISTAPFDNVYFHSEDSVLRWKYVYQRRIARERE